MRSVDFLEMLRKIVIIGAFSVAAMVSQSWNAAAEGLKTSCAGTLPNDWTFAADAIDNRFLHIVWTGPLGQTRVSVLTFYSTNADGFPVFAGTLQDTIEVMLVDGSRGAPTEGTEIMVMSEDWGWHSGVCRQLGVDMQTDTLSASFISQKISGLRDTRATNWLQRNGFRRERTLGAWRAGTSERWLGNQGQRLEIVFQNGFVSDVISVLE
ncbi:hypothetical protein KBY24_14775 [Ruegeria pomeroyi]|nr:hypothetical protein [Ruegeria pomeroyi]MCE8534653.1 hypothetical protein [Ruegeria pomeroyi]